MTKENKWFIMIMLCFSVGIVLGGLYCAFLKDSSQLYEYMQNFISVMKNGADSGEVLKKVFVNNVKLMTFFLVCAFFRFGFVPICGSAAVKGFSVGFTFAALFKYFDKNGIYIMLSQLPSSLVLLLVIVFWGAVCSKISMEKKDKSVIAVLAAIFAAVVFAVFFGAVLAGYLDTYIIKSIAVKLY